MSVKQKGFTYIGLLIFIAIIGVISVASVQVGALMQRRAAEIELLFIGNQFRTALQSYARFGGGNSYPASLEDLIKDPRSPTPRRHLRKIYIDPLTGKNQWGIVQAPNGGIMGIYSLSEDKPIKIAGFDLEFAQFEGKERYADWVFTNVPILPKPIQNKM